VRSLKGKCPSQGGNEIVNTIDHIGLVIKEKHYFIGFRGFWWSL
jgi:hypothetical protein